MLDHDHDTPTGSGHDHDPRLPPGPVTICWGAKGGSGTSVVAAALGLATTMPTVLVDLAGELPAVLGLSDPRGPGVTDWLASDAPGERLHDLAIAVADGLHLLPTGDAAMGARPARWIELIDTLTERGHRVVVDAGIAPPRELHELADRSLLVTRPCYLALRRAVAAPLRPNGVVLVTEPGRALREVDVESAVGAPVIAVVPLDPAVARAVDAGLLATRLPRSLQRDLRDAA